MPSISNKTIVWDYSDWIAGLNEQYNNNITDVPIPLAGNGVSTAIKFNPYRYFGYASPGFNATDVANVSVVTGELRNIALSAESGTNYGYLIGNNNKFHRLDIANKSLSNAGSWPRTITTGASGTPEGNDVCAYTSNISSAATPCVFYSWNDNNGVSGGDWCVGRFRTDTGGFTDNFIASSAFSSTGHNKPHPMIIGADDVLYIGDGNKLQAYDGATGADGTTSTAVLTLPQGYIITSFALIDTGAPFIVVFAYYSPSGNSVTPDTTTSGTATAFFYNYLDLDPTRIVPINDRVVTCGFSWKGTIGCFTQGNNLVNDGANRFTRLKIFDGQKFETVFTQIGNAPIHGGVDIVGDSIQWNSGGSVYAHGSPFEKMDAKTNQLAAGAGTTNGVLRTIGGATGFQLASTGLTTSGGLQYFKVATFATGASVTAPPALPVFTVGKKGKVTSVRIEFAKTSSGGRDLSAFLLYENSQTKQILSALTTVTTTNIESEYYVDITDINGSLPQFNELRPVLQWGAGLAETDAPLVKRVVVKYDEVNLIGT